MSAGSLGQLYVLALTFPVLREYAPIEALLNEDRSGLQKLADWAINDAADRGSYWAAVFILSVWSVSGLEERGLKQFDLHRAMSSWDQHQRAAFAQWAANPFWC